MIEIPKVRTPGPASHLDPGLLADIFKLPISLVAVERISSRMTPVERSYVFRSSLMKLLLRRNSLAGCRPHVRGIDILLAIVVKIGPARAHARADILNMGLA